MTSKTSLFNLGIYKNVLKRFKWGSLIYFVMLFFATPFQILTENAVNLQSRFQDSSWWSGKAVLLHPQYMTFPYLVSFVVPTVVAILVFGHVHSAKQGIFAHTLPVNRRVNYISSIFGGLTLMFVPILANGLILLVLTGSAYGAVIEPWSIGVWMALQLSVIFIMFSVTTEFFTLLCLITENTEHVLFLV